MLDELGFEVLRLPVGVDDEEFGVELLRLRRTGPVYQREAEQGQRISGGAGELPGSKTEFPPTTRRRHE